MSRVQSATVDSHSVDVSFGSKCSVDVLMVDVPSMHPIRTMFKGQLYMSFTDEPPFCPKELGVELLFSVLYDYFPLFQTAPR
jgi:hypothetical protein